jgi:hypothetical protein
VVHEVPGLVRSDYPLINGPFFLNFAMYSDEDNFQNYFSGSDSQRLQERNRVGFTRAFEFAPAAVAFSTDSSEWMNPSAPVHARA